MNIGLPGIHLVQIKAHLWFKNNYRCNLLITLHSLSHIFADITDRCYYHLCSREQEIEMWNRFGSLEAGIGIDYQSIPVKVRRQSTIVQRQKSNYDIGLT